MLTFLSDEWIAALDAAIAADEALVATTADLSLTIEQQVEDGPLGPVTYHLTFDHGAVSVKPGPAADATVRFRQNHDTAAAIAAGHGSAQRAFMTGRLRVGGDLQVLLAKRELLAELGDVFAAVRADTDLPPAPGPAGADSWDDSAPGEPG